MLWYFKMVAWFSGHSTTPVDEAIQINYKEVAKSASELRRASIRQPEDYVKISRRKMNFVLITSVFLLGVFSAAFVSFLKTDVGGRKQSFQPLPQLEHLQIADENEYYVELGSGLGIRIDPDADCEGDNPLGKSNHDSDAYFCAPSCLVTINALLC